MTSYADIGLPVFSQPPTPKKSNWSPPDQRTVIPNIACILPPNLSPDILHAFLLRFQLEEIQYKLDYLDEEIPNINFGESPMIQQTFRAQVTPDVRARDTLVKERRQVVDSIERMFPVYHLPLSFVFSMSKSVKRIDLTSAHYIGTILGQKGSNLTALERDYNVKISLRGPTTFAGQIEDPDQTSYVLVIGDNDNDVNRCCRQIEELIRTNSGPPTLSSIDISKLTLSFDPDKEIRPWMEKVKAENYKHLDDTDIKNVLREISKGDDNTPTTATSFELELAERYAIDLSYNDISTLTNEPLPPGKNP